MDLRQERVNIELNIQSENSLQAVVMRNEMLATLNFLAPRIIVSLTSNEIKTESNFFTSL